MSKNLRYTTKATQVEVRGLLDVDHFDLDACADHASHLAEFWHSEEADGLKQSWLPHRERPGTWTVWCNPPFDDIEAWVRKAWAEWTAWKCGDWQCDLVIAMLLPANRCEQPWWQELVEQYRDKPDSALRTRFLRGRVRFGTPEDPQARNAGSPPFGCVLLEWRLR